MPDLKIKIGKLFFKPHMYDAEYIEAFLVMLTTFKIIVLRTQMITVEEDSWIEVIAVSEMFDDHIYVGIDDVTMPCYEMHIGNGGRPNVCRIGDKRIVTP